MFLKLFILSIALWQASALQGGTNVALGAFPSFVAIFVPTGTTICGGAVLHPNHVLTLSSCLLSSNFQLLFANQVTVMSGHNQIDFNRPRITAQALYVNPLFNPFTLENDVGVVRLSTSFIFPEVFNPVLAPGIISNRIAHDTLNCNIAAWNRNNNQQQTLVLPILNRDTCNELPLNFGNIRESAFCAGTVTSGSGVCNTNIGAILYCNGMIEGILNSGYGCGAANNPGIYVSVRHHNAWIQDQLRRQDIPVGNTFPLERLP